jgi:hypothetical protein
MNRLRSATTTAGGRHARCVTLALRHAKGVDGDEYFRNSQPTSEPGTVEARMEMRGRKITPESPEERPFPAQ